MSPPSDMRKPGMGVACPEQISCTLSVWAVPGDRAGCAPAEVCACCAEQTGAQRSVQCSYLVAADGAGSRLRQQLGIALEGQAGLQHLCNIHFRSLQLGALLQGRPAMLYFCFGPAAVAVLVAHDLRGGEFVMQVPRPSTPPPLPARRGLAPAGEHPAFREGGQKKVAVD